MSLPAAAPCWNISKERNCRASQRSKNISRDLCVTSPYVHSVNQWQSIMAGGYDRLLQRTRSSRTAGHRPSTAWQPLLLRKETPYLPPAGSNARAQNRPSMPKSAGLPIVEPSTCSCFQKIRLATTWEGLPRVAPYMTTLPPGIARSSRSLIPSPPAPSIITSKAPASDLQSFYPPRLSIVGAACRTHGHCPIQFFLASRAHDDLCTRRHRILQGKQGHSTADTRYQYLLSRLHRARVITGPICCYPGQRQSRRFFKG